MSLDDGTFFKDNLKEINNHLEKILVVTNIIPLLYLVLTYFEIFSISYQFCFFYFFYTMITSLVYIALNRSQRKPDLTSHIGMILIVLDIAVIGINIDVNLCLTFGFAPFISCLYYNKKLTRQVLIVTFVVSILSFYIRSKSITSILIYKDRVMPMEWFWPTVAGFSMEFVIASLIAHTLVVRSQGTLQSLVKAVEEKNLANDKLIASVEKLKTTQFDLLKFVAEVLGSHDLFTGRHVMHTGRYVGLIARKMKELGNYEEELTDEKIKMLESSAFLHDIGKIHIPDSILNKVGKFTPEEFNLMKHHTEEGKKLLHYLPLIDDGAFNKIAIDMAYSHHEKWDGTGYPRGLKGLEIPLSARIMAAADVLDALISQRLYKEPMSINEAMGTFELLKGTQFEPCICDAVIECKGMIEKLDAKFKMQENTTNANELDWWVNYHNNIIKEHNSSFKI